MKHVLYRALSAISLTIVLTGCEILAPRENTVPPALPKEASVPTPVPETDVDEPTAEPELADEREEAPIEPETNIFGAFENWVCRSDAYDATGDEQVVLSRVIDMDLIDVDQLVKAVQAKHTLTADESRSVEGFAEVFLDTFPEELGTNVVVAGEFHLALFELQGVDRRWDWNEGKDAMVIEPSGLGLYYNFRLADDEGRVGPRHRFKCEKK